LSSDLAIVNKKGLHARAAARFVQCVERFDVTVTVSRDQHTVGGTSIMGLMMLAAGPRFDDSGDRKRQGGRGRPRRADRPRRRPVRRRRVI
jgi:hypothetical protein